MEGARPRFYDPTTKTPGINPPSAINFLGCDRHPSEGDFKGPVHLPMARAHLCCDCSEPYAHDADHSPRCPACRIEAAKARKTEYRAKGGA